jgi:chorismate--pyruvate lyase
LGVFSLRVLAEYGQAVPIDEARAMRLQPGTRVWVREVLMSLDGIDGVVARSLTPLAASRSTWQGMRRLRTRPLADMLYHDRTVQRSAFECRRLAPGVPFHATALTVAAGALAPRNKVHGNVVDIRDARRTRAAINPRDAIDTRAVMDIRNAIYARHAMSTRDAMPMQEAALLTARILARRSVFWRHGQPLLVAEGFLPAFWVKAANRRPL